MTRLLAACALCCLIVAGGCIPTLHPTYRPEDVIFDPALLGVWQGEDAVWLLGNGPEEKTYRVVQISDEKDEEVRAGAFTARLVSTGGLKLLDLQPAQPPGSGTEYYTMHFVPAHTFMRVDQIEPTLRVRMLKPDWLSDLLEESPEALKHEQIEDAIIITASTDELQAFIKAQAQTEDAWTDAVDLTRLASSSASSAPAAQPVPAGH